MWKTKEAIAEKREAELIEELAALEHKQWTVWTQSLADCESISTTRRDRWESFWMPYGLLSEETKEDDRVWARQALKIMRDAEHFYCEKDAKDQKTKR